MRPREKWIFVRGYDRRLYAWAEVNYTPTRLKVIPKNEFWS